MQSASLAIAGTQPGEPSSTDIHCTSHNASFGPAQALSASADGLLGNVSDSLPRNGSVVPDWCVPLPSILDSLLYSSIGTNVAANLNLTS